MKLKKHGALLVNFVIDFANGDMSREDFDLDYSGYVVEHFPEFEREHPRLSRRFADTIDRTYSTCSWMTDEAFQYAMGDAVDTFLGEAPVADCKFRKQSHICTDFQPHPHGKIATPSRRSQCHHYGCHWQR